MNRTSIFRFLTLMVLSICLTQPAMARETERNADTQMSLKIQRQDTRRTAHYSTHIAVGSEGPGSAPSRRDGAVLRMYRQSEQAPLGKQDIYLTGSAEGINRALHAPSATWATK